MNLIDTVKGYITPDVISHAATSFDETPHATAKAMNGLIPVILNAIAHKNEDVHTPGNIISMIGKFGTHEDVLSNVSKVFSKETMDRGKQLASSLFGDNFNIVSNALSRFAGIKTSSSTGLMGVVSSIVSGALLKKFAANFSLPVLRDWFAREKHSFSYEIPASLATLLPGNKVMSSGIYTPYSKKKKKSDWIWPVVLAVLVIGLCIYLFRSCNNPTNVDDSNRTIITATDSAKIDIASLGQFFKRQLPDSVELNIPENGIENKLLKFIEDKNKPVDKTTWFSFDRLTFESNSSRLKPESKEQMNNIAAILKAYPKVHLKFGGYTDNTGDSLTNLKLSAERALAVKNDFIERGIDSVRLSSEGFGQQFPVADNATEAGRAKNRRIDLRVIEK